MMRLPHGGARRKGDAAVGTALRRVADARQELRGIAPDSSRAEALELLDAALRHLNKACLALKGQL